jgi:predicted amidohydrolase
MRVAAIQHDIVWEDRDANFARLAPMIDAAAHAGARLVLLAEMFAVGFSMDTAKTRECFDGASAQFLSDQARAHGCWVGGSIPELGEGVAANDDARPFNTFVLAAPDGTRHRYRKIHPFTYAREEQAFAAGDAFTTVDIAIAGEGVVRTSLFVCYDLRFGDEMWALARTTDLYLFPANWPDSRRHHWRSLLVARAIENQAYVVGCNRVGDAPPKLHYAGDSMIVDPLGETLASAADGESIVFADVDAERVRVVRERFPFLRDRR